MRNDGKGALCISRVLKRKEIHDGPWGVCLYQGCWRGIGGDERRHSGKTLAGVKIEGLGESRGKNSSASSEGQTPDGVCQ